jgi:glucose/arabinose dehydrogenase
MSLKTRQPPILSPCLGAGRASRRGRPGALLMTALVLALSACAEMAKLPVAAGTGPQPTLPPPNQTLLPTVNIAPATGWPAGATPLAVPGMRVAAFAQGLDHPRWLYVLPNGDVLMAETNAPPKPDDAQGIRGWIMGLVMKRAGARVPSANRIALLRDTNGDGVADLRSVLLQGLNSPFGMALVGNDLYVANSDAVLRFPYTRGDTRITVSDTPVVEPPSPQRLHSDFVPFEGGKPVGMPVNVLTGFLSEDGKAFGRPVGVVIDTQGALLVADDVGNVVWRVSAAH